MLYWWWFIGLSFVFLVGVATVVLPIPTGKSGPSATCPAQQNGRMPRDWHQQEQRSLIRRQNACRHFQLPDSTHPAGWVVRKQLARALRQEGKVLEAIVELMTAEGSDPGSLGSGGMGTGGSGKSPAGGKGSGGAEGADGHAGSGDVDALGDVRGGVVFPDFMTLEQGADAWEAAAQWPAGPQAEQSSLLGRVLARLWRHSKAGSRRITSRISMTLRGSRPNLHKEAESMGIHPGACLVGYLPFPLAKTQLWLICSFPSRVTLRGGARRPRQRPAWLLNAPGSQLPPHAPHPASSLPSCPQTCTQRWSMCTR